MSPLYSREDFVTKSDQRYAVLYGLGTSSLYVMEMSIVDRSSKVGEESNFTGLDKTALTLEECTRARRVGVLEPREVGDWCRMQFTQSQF